MNDPNTSREDLEALQIEKERQSDQLEGFKQVERIVSQRDADANADIDHDHRKLLTFLSTLLSLITSPFSS